MSDRRDLFDSVKECTSGIPAVFVAAMGSALTSLAHSLKSEELLYGNMVALGTVLFIFYRAILMALDMWLKTQADLDRKAREAVAEDERDLAEGQRSMGEAIGDLSEDIREQNIAEAIRKNQVKLEKEISPDLPERLKKTDGEL